jgi:betaine lipid synthase
MPAQPFTPLDLEMFFLGGLLVATTVSVYLVTYYAGPYVVFAYNCFFKPIGTSSGKGSLGGQQDALESFYKGQAAIYDATRSRLLRGREEMMALAAAQLRLKNEREGFKKRVWIDVRDLCILAFAPELTLLLRRSVAVRAGTSNN